ncbi:MAG: MFS transporter [Chitinophagaceae bacterium]|nr:MFS transporter [Chitinophagaceae bacterium]
MKHTISSTIPSHVLPLIVLSQFAGTSVWFAGNAILPALQIQYQLPDSMLGNITTAVQSGFIIGTLVFALFSIADRFSPVQLFMWCALLAATFNILIIWLSDDVVLLLTCRLLTGFFLAGVYPVGMKIAADWYAKGLGKAVGFHEGSMVAGKAFPHLIKSTIHVDNWQQVIIFTSMIAASGGLLVGFFLSNGPHRVKSAGLQKVNLVSLFKNNSFKAASFGYFGHMWELYTFWAFIPMMITWYNHFHENSIPVSFWSFVIIGIGCISCILGGSISNRIGSAKVAWISLIISGICCLLSPLFFFASPFIFLIALMIWGCFVIADSPQFSALVSQTAPTATKGTALTLVTSIGFAITIVSIETMNLIWNRLMPETVAKYWLLPILAIGPVFGLFHMKSLVRKN